MARTLEYFRLFDRCFFAVRVATALELRLRREPARAVDAAFADRDEAREDRADRLETEGEAERADSATPADRLRLDADRDRERETEPASLPVLLKTLDAVAVEAAALPGPEPAALPTLRELLAHMAPDAPAPTAVTAPRLDLRARLAGSGAVMLRAPPQPLKSAAGLAIRRATGPPRR